MNLHEAQSIIEKLNPYRGREMHPFNCPVKDFLILPAAQEDFDTMLKDLTYNKTTFTAAIAPYQNNVTVLVCSDTLHCIENSNHCSLEYFLKANSISL